MHGRDASETDATFAQELTRVERGIARGYDRDVDLRRIVRAGADRKALLRLLALAVIPGADFFGHMRAAQKRVRGLAGQMETVASNAKRLAEEPASYLDFWAWLCNREDFYGYPMPKHHPPLSLFDSMERYAKALRVQVRTMCRYLRQNVPKERNLPVVLLLLYVHNRTSQTFYQELARLLADASEIAGSPRAFSPGKLGKLFQRRIRQVAPRSPSQPA